MKKTWCAFLAALFCMPAGACSKKNADSNFVLLNGFENYESATRAAYKAIYGLSLIHISCCFSFMRQRLFTLSYIA